MRFRHQFLITYRSFTTPLVLLEKLRERFNSMPAIPPRESTDRPEWERQRKLIHLRVLTVLSRWITDLYEDWNDAELRNALSSFLDEAPSNVAPLCNQIRALLTKPVRNAGFIHASNSKCTAKRRWRSLAAGNDAGRTGNVLL